MIPASPAQGPLGLRFSQLRPDAQLDLANLIVSKQVELKQNVDTGEYEAFIRLPRRLPPAACQSSRPKSAVVARVAGRAHPSASGFLPQKIKKSSGKSAEETLRQPSLNEKFANFFTFFQKIFAQAEFTNLGIRPKAFELAKFGSRLDSLFDLQFRLLLRSKSTAQSSLVAALLQHHAAFAHQNNLFAMQFLTDFAYTVFVSQGPGMELVRSFLLETQGSQRQALWLYLRQVLKVILCIQSLPGSLFVFKTGSQVLDDSEMKGIISKAFYWDAGLISACKLSFRQQFPGKEPIPQPTALLFLFSFALEQGILEDSTPVVDRIASLYDLHPNSVSSSHRPHQLQFWLEQNEALQETAAPQKQSGDNAVLTPPIFLNNELIQNVRGVVATIVHRIVRNFVVENGLSQDKVRQAEPKVVAFLEEKMWKIVLPFFQSLKIEAGLWLLQGESPESLESLEAAIERFRIFFKNNRNQESLFNEITNVVIRILKIKRVENEITFFLVYQFDLAGIFPCGDQSEVRGVQPGRYTRIYSQDVPKKDSSSLGRHQEKISQDIQAIKDNEQKWGMTRRIQDSFEVSRDQKVVFEKWKFNGMIQKSEWKIQEEDQMLVGGPGEKTRSIHNDVKIDKITRKNLTQQLDHIRF